MMKVSCRDVFSFAPAEGGHEARGESELPQSVEIIKGAGDHNVLRDLNSYCTWVLHLPNVQGKFVEQTVCEFEPPSAVCQILLYYWWVFLCFLSFIFFGKFDIRRKQVISQHFHLKELKRIGKEFSLSDGILKGFHFIKFCHLSKKKKEKELFTYQQCLN